LAGSGAPGSLVGSNSLSVGKALPWTILEVDRPDRSDRRRKGEDDDLDAINAARAALHQRRTAIPKSKDGAVEALTFVVKATFQGSRGRDVPFLAKLACGLTRYNRDRPKHTQLVSAHHVLRTTDQRSPTR
jgi:hypothetical protein